jgi:hypothetical protein
MLGALNQTQGRWEGKYGKADGKQFGPMPAWLKPLFGGDIRFRRMVRLAGLEPDKFVALRPPF